MGVPSTSLHGGWECPRRGTPTLSAVAPAIYPDATAGATVKDLVVGSGEGPEIVRGGVDDGGVLGTRLDLRQAMVACREQWRCSIVDCDDTGLQDQIRGIEAVLRMLHAVMLEAVAELESRDIAAASGFGGTQRLLAGMLQLSATEAGMRLTHATQLAPRRAVNGEVLCPALANTAAALAAALAAGQIGVG
jgi:hypothetical protein